jgi:UDP-glucose 4-epimerase
MNPLRAFETNTLDVINLVDLAKKTGAMFIQASTSAVYENVQQVPFNENLLVNPTLTYPMSKKFAEDYIVSTGITNNLNYHILRFFNVFSPKQDLMRARPPLVNYILREIAYERVPQIFAPLEQRRDYVCVDDVVSLICRLLARSNELSQNHILNVCRGEAISILEIIDSIKIGLGRNFRYELSEPQKLWDDQLSQLDEFYPFNRSLVAKETLKPSLGDPLRALNELGWAAEHDTLNCISENASAIFLRASKYNDCKS